MAANPHDRRATDTESHGDTLQGDGPQGSQQGKGLLPEAWTQVPAGRPRPHQLRDDHEGWRDGVIAAVTSGGRGRPLTHPTDQRGCGFEGNVSNTA